MSLHNRGDFYITNYGKIVVEHELTTELQGMLVFPPLQTRSAHVYLGVRELATCVVVKGCIPLVAWYDKQK